MTWQFRVKRWKLSRKIVILKPFFFSMAAIRFWRLAHFGRSGWELTVMFWENMSRLFQLILCRHRTLRRTPTICSELAISVYMKHNDIEADFVRHSHRDDSIGAMWAVRTVTVLPQNLYSPWASQCAVRCAKPLTRRPCWGSSVQPGKSLAAPLPSSGDIADTQYRDSHEPYSGTPHALWKIATHLQRRTQQTPGMLLPSGHLDFKLWLMTTSPVQYTSFNLGVLFFFLFFF